MIKAKLNMSSHANVDCFIFNQERSLKYSWFFSFDFIQALVKQLLEK